MAASLSTAGSVVADARVPNGAAEADEGACSGCHNAQPFVKSPRAVIDQPRRIILHDAVNESSGEYFAGFSIDMYWPTYR